MASGCSQSSFDPYDLSSNDEEYLKLDTVAEWTAGRSDHAAWVFTAARLHLNSLSDAPKKWVQVNPNFNDYYSDPIKISSTLWIPDITDWWHQQEEMHSKYPDLSNVACDICSIISHGVRVQARCSLGQVIISCSQLNTPGKTLRKEVVVRQFAGANNRIFAGSYTAPDSMERKNELDLKRQVEEWKLHRVAKVHASSEMWQGSQNLCPTPKESPSHNKHMASIGYISTTEEIVKASWQNFQHDGSAAFTLSERSPLPPALSAKDIPGGQTQALNDCRISRTNRHQAEWDVDSAPESISDSENWLNWNCDLDHPNVSDDNWEEDDETIVNWDNGIECQGSPERQDVSVLPNFPGLIRPTGRSMKKA